MPARQQPALIEDDHFIPTQHSITPIATPATTFSFSTSESTPQIEVTATTVDPATTPTVDPATSPNVRTKIIFPKILEITGRAYSDQTGKFLVTSASGMKYLFVLYDYDSSLIWAILSRQETKSTSFKLIRTQSNYWNLADSSLSSNKWTMNAQTSSRST